MPPCTLASVLLHVLLHANLRFLFFRAVALAIPYLLMDNPGVGAEMGSADGLWNRAGMQFRLERTRLE
jgi:hypothetical protein